MIYDFYAAKTYELLQVPTKLLKNDKPKCSYQHEDANLDLSILSKDLFNFKNKKAAIVITQNYLYFAKILIKNTPYSLLIGPCFNTYPSDEIERSILHELGLSTKELKALETVFNTIPETELRVFINTVILMDLLINNEKLEHSDLLLDKEIPNYITNISPDKKRRAASFVEREEAEKLKSLTEFYIKNGMVEELEKMYGQYDSRYIGKMAKDSVRQARNTLIVSATLFSRAAIEGGLNIVTALSMSDIYIQKVEMLSDYYAIMTLQSEMIVNLAKAVALLKTKGAKGNFIKSIHTYILNHIEEKIYTDDIAKELFLNKSYVTTKFKAMIGKTITEYITELKIDEAKRLMKVTDKTLSEISEQLAFSSQSYFQNVFKKQTGMTPNEYKETL